MTTERVGTGRLVTVFWRLGFSSGVTLCGPWRATAGACASPAAGPISPFSCNRSAVRTGDSVQANLRDAASWRLRCVARTRQSIWSHSRRGRQAEIRGHSGGSARTVDASRQGRRNHQFHPLFRPSRRCGAARLCARKAQGEQAVLEAVPEAVILRPSVYFGPETISQPLRDDGAILPVIPIVGAKTKFQPVYVGDVARAVALALKARRQGRDLRTRRPE